MADQIPAIVEDPKALKGSYIRNSRTDEIYKIHDVGPDGVTTRRAEGFGGGTFGPETLITWRLFKAIYVIMVHAAEIDVKDKHLH